MKKKLQVLMAYALIPALGRPAWSRMARATKRIPVFKNQNERNKKDRQKDRQTDRKEGRKKERKKERQKERKKRKCNEQLSSVIVLRPHTSFPWMSWNMAAENFLFSLFPFLIW